MPWSEACNRCEWTWSFCHRRVHASPVDFEMFCALRTFITRWYSSDKMVRAPALKATTGLLLAAARQCYRWWAILKSCFNLLYPQLKKSLVRGSSIGKSHLSWSLARRPSLKYSPPMARWPGMTYRSWSSLVCSFLALVSGLEQVMSYWLQNLVCSCQRCSLFLPPTLSSWARYSDHLTSHSKSKCYGSRVTLSSKLNLPSWSGQTCSSLLYCFCNFLDFLSFVISSPSSCVPCLTVGCAHFQFQRSFRWRMSVSQHHCYLLSIWWKLSPSLQVSSQTSD